ncbi:MAG: alpha/beta fold hydrolase [Burkholderiaceae bacterium]|nr:alpha/beta fold hydrolase [Burkholderiaceae bacterium]
MNMPFVREQGVGPSVVCFHSNCSNSGQFKGLMDMLGSHFHVLAFDAYGAGKTPAWSRSTYLSLSDEVALAEAVMLRAGELVILVGHSYGAAVALMQVCGGSQSFNAVNQMRILGRWMRMLTIPNQSSVAKAFLEFEENGRMKPSAYYDRVVDVMEELLKFTLLTRDVLPYLVDRYSERKESAEELVQRVNQRSN